MQIEKTKQKTNPRLYLKKQQKATFLTRHLLHIVHILFQMIKNVLR